MKGYFIYNKFLNNNKFKTLRQYFYDESKKINIDLEFVDNSFARLLLFNHKFVKKDFVLFWDKDVILAEMLEQNNHIVINSSKSIELCDDKSKTYIALSKTNIAQPLTIISPLIYYGDISSDDYFINFSIDKLGFPMIVKECFGSFGEQVYLCKNNEDLCNVISKIGNKPFVLQEFIDTSYGRDIRIEVIGNEVVATILRENKNNDFRANITNGAIASKYNPTLDQINMALDACHALGLDFCGVDILFGENEKPILCEVNSNAYPLNVQNITGVNIVKKILEHIKNKL